MPKRIAIVDGRLDLLLFLKESLEVAGYEIIPCFTEDEAEALMPVPDLTLVDFEPQVDLAEVFLVIEAGLGNPEDKFGKESAR